MNEAELPEFPYHNEACARCHHSAEMHGVLCNTGAPRCFVDNCTCTHFIMNMEYHQAAKLEHERRLKQ